MLEDVEGPYWEDYVSIEPDDHYQGVSEYQCPECDKYFEVIAEPSIDYTARGKADCLNGAEHKWILKAGYPEIHYRGKYRCEDCSAEKEVKEELATKEEWDKYWEDMRNDSEL